MTGAVIAVNYMLLHAGASFCHLAQIWCLKMLQHFFVQATVGNDEPNINSQDPEMTPADIRRCGCATAGP